MLTCGNDELTLLRGTFVESVLPDGPCYSIVNTGDRVIAVNGQCVEEKNYLEVVDIIQELTGDVLLTLARHKQSEHSSAASLSSSPFSGAGSKGPDKMPGRLESGANCKTPERTKLLENGFPNGNPKFVEMDSNRNISALDCNGFRSLSSSSSSQFDKNDNEINNNVVQPNPDAPQMPESPSSVSSPPVPARRRRKNTYKSSLSTDSVGLNGESTENGSLSLEISRSYDGRTRVDVGGVSFDSRWDDSQSVASLPPLTSPELGQIQRTLLATAAAENEIKEELAREKIEEMGIPNDSELTGGWETATTGTSTSTSTSITTTTTTGENHLGESFVANGNNKNTSSSSTSESEGESRVYKVTLEKINASFGFRVAERYQFEDGFRRGIFVHSLIPRGAAEFHGDIKPGDQLIKINGTSTEGLSYKEGVALLKKSPHVGKLCFQRSAHPVVSNSDVLTPSNEDEDNMIAKWGRRGSRTSLASESTLDSTGSVTHRATTPTYARSISQVVLPTVSELRALADKDPKDFVLKEEVTTRALIHHSKDDGFGDSDNTGYNFIDISGQAYTDKKLTNGFGENGSVRGVSNERSSQVANGSVQHAGSNSGKYFGRSISSPILDVPETHSPNNSANSSSKELLGVVPEDYSLNSFDSVFHSETSHLNKSEGSRPSSRVTGSAAKYLASQGEQDNEEDENNGLPESYDNHLLCDTSSDYTGSGQSSPDGINEPKPVPRRRKRKCGLIEKPEDVFKYVTQDNCFQVSVRKSSRGLGLAIFGGVDMSRLGPICQLIRIRKLYPLQPAVACGELQVGDVILEVNGLNMIGLTNTEALETLRVASNDVLLKIFRPELSLMPPVSFFIQDLSPASSAMISPTGSASNTLQRPTTLNCGSSLGNTSLEITLVKQDGTLGFSIFRYEKACDMDTHPSGIYVKALIRDPAISNGQIQAGDRILEVNGKDVSDCCRNDAVNLLRNATDTVTLKIYRFADPLSPCSLEDTPHSKPLRIEARELLSDKARRKSDGNSSSPKRTKERCLKKESVSSASSAESKSSFDVPLNLNLPGSIIESPSPSPEAKPESFPLPLTKPDVDIESDESNEDLNAGMNRNSRPKSLDLLCINEKKQNSVRSQAEGEDANQLFHRQASVVVTNSNDANNDKQQIDEKGEGLLKWRGATLLSNEENVTNLNLSLSTLSSGCQSPLSNQSQNGSNGELYSPPVPPRRLTSLQSWDSTPEETEEFLSSGQKLRKLYVQLDRGWQSRLGFSLGDDLPPNSTQLAPQISSPVVTVVHPGSLAYKDGRILVGDRLIEVNGEALMDKTAAEVIDLLRKTRGKIHFVFLRLASETCKEPLI